MKVETHNHPTAFLRGRARRPVPAVKSAMKVHRARREAESWFGWFLRFQPAIPGFEQPWEEDFGKPERIVTRWTS